MREDRALAINNCPIPDMYLYNIGKEIYKICTPVLIGKYLFKIYSVMLLAPQSQAKGA